MSNASPIKENFQDERQKNRKGLKRRDVLLSSGAVLAASTLMGEALNTASIRAANARASATTPKPLPPDQIGEVATSAYIYAYPLIMMELTRRVGTNVTDTRQITKAPMNQFANVPAFPDATYGYRTTERRHSLFAHVVRRIEGTAADQCARLGRALLSAADG